MDLKVTPLVKRLARLQSRHPWRFIVGALAVTAATAVLAARLGFDPNWEALLPEGAPEIENVERVRDRVGSTRQLVVAIGGEDPEKRRAFGRLIVPELEALEDARFVDMEFPVDFLEDRALLFLDADRLDALVDRAREAVEATRWFHNPLNPHLDEEGERAEVESLWKAVEEAAEMDGERLPVGGLIESSDGKYTFVLVVTDFKLAEMKRVWRFLDDVRETVEEMDPQGHGVTVRYSGQIVLMQEHQKRLTRDLRMASIIALILGIIVVALTTRRWIAPLAVGLPLVMGVMWTFAIVAWTIGHVNVITGFLVAVLIGLGIDFGIHLVVRYEQEAEAEPVNAMVRAVGATFRPALTSALTTACTFLSFAIARFRGFSEFGLIAAVGVMLTLVASFLVLPPVIMLADRRRTLPRYLGPGLRKRPISPAIAGLGVAVFCAAAVYGATQVRQIEFHNDLTRLQGRPPAAEFLEYVDGEIGQRFNATVLLVDSVEEARQAAALVREGMKDPASAFGSLITVSDLLPEDVDARMQRIEKLRELVNDPKLDRAKGERKEKIEEARRLVQVEPWSVEDLPEVMSRRFATRDGGFIVYLWPRWFTNTSHEALAWEGVLDGLGEELRQAGVENMIGDEHLIIGWTHRAVVRDAPTLFAVASLVVLLLLLLDFRSLRAALLVALPLAVGLLVFAALVRLSGQELNFFNIIIIPTAVGIGIDDAVHFYHRYRAEGRGSAMLVIRRTGMAALVASITTACGFGSILVSDHPGLRSMGTLAVTGIACLLAAAVIFFPCVLTLLEKGSRTLPPSPRTR